MGSASHSLNLLVLISISTFLIFNFQLTDAAWDLKNKPEEDKAAVRSSLGFQYNVLEQSIEVVSGEDNVGGEMDTSMLTRFRLLLGLETLDYSQRLTHQISPAPASVEEALAPSPDPPFHAHIYTRSPLHNSQNGRRNQEKAKLRRIIIAMIVSVGASFVVISGVTILLVCKRSRRTRPSSASNKVSYDPGPELFYLNSLAPFLEIDSSVKQYSSESKNVLSNESMSSSGPSHDGELGNCESETVSCLDEDILHIESLSSSDGDESFHSVHNSHSSAEIVSIVSEADLSCVSGKCSPINSSHGSTSPDYRLTQFPPIKPPISPTIPLNLHNPPCSPSQRLESSTSQAPCSSHIEGGESLRSSHSSLPCNTPKVHHNDDSNTEHATNLEMTSLANKSKCSSPIAKTSSNLLNQELVSIPKQTTQASNPSLSSHTTSRPIISPPMPSVTNGNIPKPPPPPLPPLKPPSFQNGCNSRQPPPPPLPRQLQQSTPVSKDGTPLPKLKPLHWDKVRAAPDRSMVWDKIRSSSFELDEKMIESLFGYNLQSSAKSEEAKNKSLSPSKHVLDHKRLQNITILLKALNANTEQVCEALMQGRGLSTQQLEALAKMVPSKEEEEKLSNYKGDINELGSAERFVKAILNMPFAFSRIEVMLYRETFDDEIVHLKKSFAMLEGACKELRSSQLFLRLLEAVLKTGNRMNVGTIRGGARAFKLDTLLKLADVKGTDGKTTLLHFVVQEIIRSEGVTAMEKTIKKNKPKTAEEREEDYRVMGLDIVSGLSTELCNVKKTASIDLDVLASSVSNLSEGMNQLKHLVEVDLSIGEKNRNFVNSMKSFLIQAERIIKELEDDENRVLVLVREITEYYHGDVSKDEANPLRIFVIVRDFLGMLDRVCKEVRSLKAHQSLNHTISFR